LVGVAWILAAQDAMWVRGFLMLGGLGQTSPPTLFASGVLQNVKAPFFYLFFKKNTPSPNDEVNG
jgi:hypothetical protein